MTSINKYIAGAVASGFALLATGAHAADGNNGWTMSALENSKGDPWGSALITNSANSKDVGFRCIDGTLLVAFALEPGDVMAAFKRAGPQKWINIEVAVNGAEPEKQKWSLLKRHKVVASADQKVTRRLYNAAVRGETVMIDARARGGGEYDLPSPDPSAFASFMEACGFSAKQS